MESEMKASAMSRRAGSRWRSQSTTVKAVSSRNEDRVSSDSSSMAVMVKYSVAAQQVGSQSRLLPILARGYYREVASRLSGDLDGYCYSRAGAWDCGIGK